MSHPWQDAHEREFDVVVIGSGYAGWSAALSLRAKGTEVLLVGSRGDLVWESGRGFDPIARQSVNPNWLNLTETVAARGGHVSDWLDGAIAEVTATEMLCDSGATVLYYAWPVAVEHRDGDLAGLIVATKSGLRRVRGRQWIDATESGELLRLLDENIKPVQPSSTCAYAMLQHPDWSRFEDGLPLTPTGWETQRTVEVALPEPSFGWRSELLPVLADLAERMGREIGHVTLSHMSFEPVRRYATAGERPLLTERNVAVAVPGLCGHSVVTLADRCELGTAAAAELAALRV